VIEAILPPEASASSARQDEDSAVLFPEEAAVIARAVDRRRREFATGRACARAALARLGIPACPILPGTRGAPQRPADIVGSITHCDGYRATAVARSADLLAVGLDAEPNAELPDGVLQTIATEREMRWIRELTGNRPDVHWDRLLFSAKESVRLFRYLSVAIPI
jgi:4'-phosphopantetheinyl transferase EntD